MTAGPSRGRGLGDRVPSVASRRGARSSRSRLLPGGGRLLLALGCGLALALAYPRVSFVPFAWLAPVAWLAASARAGARRGLLMGFAFGAGFFGLLLGFVHGVLTHFTALPLFLTIPIWILLVGYLALYPAACGAIVGALGARFGDAGLLGAPAVWVALEVARGIMIGGFPWGLAGYAATGGLALAQAAAIGGIHLVSFLVAAAWSSLALLLLAVPAVSRGLGRLAAGSLPADPDAARRRAGRAARIVAAALVAVVGAAAAWGALRLRAHPAPDPGVLRPAPGAPKAAGALRVSLVQGGWGGDLDAEEAALALRDYTVLTQEAVPFAPDLIVWPESNAPYGPETTDGYLDRLTALARETRATLLLGAVGEDGHGHLTNSAYLVGGSGILDRYDKRRLLQYGEYVPMQSWFPFIRKFVPEAGTFVPGSRVGVVPGPGRVLGIAICYEMIFPEETRADALAGAGLLVNITNDSWYPASGPAQHAAYASFRAIETGLWAVRAASTGISLVSDPLGRTVVSGPQGPRLPYRLDAELPPLHSQGAARTPFMRWGDWAGKGCATVAAGLLAFLTLGNKIDRQRTRPAPPPRNDGPA